MLGPLAQQAASCGSAVRWLATPDILPARKPSEGQMRQILELSIQNEAHGGARLVDVVTILREDAPRFIHDRLESTALLFPRTAASTSKSPRKILVYLLAMKTISLSWLAMNKIANVICLESLLNTRKKAKSANLLAYIKLLLISRNAMGVQSPSGIRARS
jgi:hypothetical protein